MTSVRNGERSYLVTGAAGFIGSALSKRLLSRGCRVIGFDNLNDYYDVRLKRDRLAQLADFDNFELVTGDLSDREALSSLFRLFRPKVVLHLAAQAGVRYSVENPQAYISSNIVGFFNVLEECRHNSVDHLLYASSSSVYGANTEVPFRETDFVDHPVSLYAATKKSNELMAYAYSHLYAIPSTGLRFFTVYGPMGRPDMAYYLFSGKFFAGESIELYSGCDGENDLYRDFTYIDDVVDSVELLVSKPPDSRNPSRVFNIGNSSPERLMDFVEALEVALSKSCGRTVVFKKVFLPMKAGDVPVTYASTDLLEGFIGFRPSTPLAEGLQRFADWYVEYYGVS